MTDPKYLLGDSQVQQFIRDGYIQLEAGFGQPVHQNIYDALEEVFEKEGNVGNNILPRIPQIKQVFAHPTVSGALISLLGPGYTMNPHRHCHLNPPGGKGQTWHKGNPARYTQLGTYIRPRRIADSRRRPIPMRQGVHRHTPAL